ncbi:MAG: hypothetical protein MJK04_26985 [Psychrosphaera sp.]|nr:hypothetical protein [Psychrosphaera sp.]
MAKGQTNLVDQWLKHYKLTISDADVVLAFDVFNVFNSQEVFCVYLPTHNRTAQDQCLIKPLL